MVAAHEGKHKDLVKFIGHSTCLQERQVYDLVNGLSLKKEVLRISSIPQPERIQPSIYIECLGAPDPVALAKQALEEGWTADQTRKEAKRLKNEEIQKTRISA